MATTVRLHPLRTGEMLVPPQLLERVPGPFGTPRALGVGVPKTQRVWIPVPAFLIEHPAEGPLLVDSGLPALAATDFRGATNATMDRLYEIRMDPADGLAAQVSARGVDPASIELVVMTHLHADHAAGLPELPRATVAATATEFAAGDASPLQRMLGGYHLPHYEGRARRVLEVERAPAWGAFEHALDLFGDGSVRVLFTPGHTAGHCSVAAATDSGEVIIAGDVAYTRAAVYGAAEPGLRAKPKLLKASLAQLRRHVKAHSETVVIPGHDPEAWAALDAVY